LIELLTLFDLYFIVKVNRVINKYNSIIKSKFVLISLIIFFQYALLLLLFAFLIFNIHAVPFFNFQIEGTIITSLWLLTWTLSISFYTVKLVIFTVINRLNLIYYFDKIEIIINTSHYYQYEYIEKVKVTGLMRTEKDNVVIMGGNGRKYRTIKCDWIEKINILNANGLLKRSISRNTIKNTIIESKIEKQRKITFKIFKKPGSE